jgi:methionyl-tRNA formyltransferase
MLRVAILSDALFQAARIEHAIRKVPQCEIIAVVVTSGNTWLRGAARWLRHNYRWRSVQLLVAGRVIFLSRPLDYPESLETLRKANFDVGLLNSGVIYREPTIRSFRLGILNPHIGILPEYRGRSVMEWSLLQGDRTGITVFFIDAGIDTGERIVLMEYIDVRHAKSSAEAKQFLFAQDARLFRKALERLQSPQLQYEINDAGAGRRYYVMSNLFLGVVNEILTQCQKSFSTGHVDGPPSSS